MTSTDRPDADADAVSGAVVEDGELDLVVRPAAAGDAPVLADLFLAAREAAYPAMPRPVHPPESVRAWFAEQLSPDRSEGRETWVAEQDAEVVGFLTLTSEWLDSLYVRPGTHGQGIGSVLVDLAKGLRPDGFGLWVFESNEPARRFYARHGLTEVERTDGSENEEQAPDIRMMWPGAVGDLRRRIDRVDDRLAELLEERAALSAEIQRLKQVPGHAGRDAAREAEIVERMARRAPSLGVERLRRIMHTVITASLDAAEDTS